MIRLRFANSYPENRKNKKTQKYIYIYDCIIAIPVNWTLSSAYNFTTKKKISKVVVTTKTQFLAAELAQAKQTEYCRPKAA
jgi:hypothetical protein